MMTGETRYLTDEEVAERYRGAISTGTLRNWRAARVGPAYIKSGKSVLYSAEALDAWDKANTVPCSQAKPKITPVTLNPNEEVRGDVEL